MIRDPSDGSVKSAPDFVAPQKSAERGPAVTPDWAGAGTNSGLPPTTAKAEYLARLEESRKWLENYVRPTING